MSEISFNSSFEVYANLKEVISKFYDLFARGDLAAVSQMLHDDAVWIQMDGFPGGGTFKGREAIVQHVFKKLKGDWENWRAIVERTYEGEGVVFVTGRYSGTNVHTSKTFTSDFVHVYELEENRIKKFKQYTDTARIVQATVQ